MFTFRSEKKRSKGQEPGTTTKTGGTAPGPRLQFIDNRPETLDFRDLRGIRRRDHTGQPSSPTEPRQSQIHPTGPTTGASNGDPAHHGAYGGQPVQRARGHEEGAVQTALAPIGAQQNAAALQNIQVHIGAMQGEVQAIQQGIANLDHQQAQQVHVQLQAIIPQLHEAINAAQIAAAA